MHVVCIGTAEQRFGHRNGQQTHIDGMGIGVKIVAGDLGQIGGRVVIGQDQFDDLRDGAFDRPDILRRRLCGCSGWGKY